MTLEEDFDALLIDHIYEDVVKPAVTQANQIMRRSAPRVRDLPQNTGATLSDRSNDSQAVVRLYSNSKSPDVLETAGKRRNGRPPGARVGVRSPTQPYANGVDLANITNGQRGGGTRRTTPLATHGWYDRAEREAFALFR